MKTGKVRADTTVGGGQRGPAAGHLPKAVFLGVIRSLSVTGTRVLPGLVAPNAVTDTGTARARLRAARMAARTNPPLAGVDLDRTLAIAGLADEAVHSGAAGYALLVANKARRELVPPHVFEGPRYPQRGCSDTHRSNKSDVWARPDGGPRRYVGHAPGASRAPRWKKEQQGRTIPGDERKERHE